MNQSQRKILTSLGMAAGALTVYRTWRHLTDKSGARPMAMQQLADNSHDPVSACRRCTQNLASVPNSN